MLATLQRPTFASRVWLPRTTCRCFHPGNFVTVHGSDIRGVVLERSNSGKTFQVQFGSETQRHHFEMLRLWKPHQARIFINGDAMPAEITFDWLTEQCNSHDDLQIWKAVSAQRANVVHKVQQRLEKLPGVSKDSVHIVQTRSQVKNAADALLTALFGRHARPDAMNYILSDKEWFSELPHVFADMPTIWMKFRDLGAPIADWRPPYWPSSWTTGYYVLPHTADLQRGFRRKSSVIRELAVGECVEVKEVENNFKDERVRGRVVAGGSDGWISLQSMQDAHCWALPVSR